MVAVGTRISPRAPHRSRRALLTHRAPPSVRRREMPRGTPRLTRGRGGWLVLTPWETFTSYSLPASWRTLLWVKAPFGPSASVAKTSWRRQRTSRRLRRRCCNPALPSILPPPTFLPSSNPGSRGLRATRGNCSAMLLVQSLAPGNVACHAGVQSACPCNHTSNGHHQRMSVSVVACPRNHFRYNSLAVPVKPPGRIFGRSRSRRASPWLNEFGHSTSLPITCAGATRGREGEPNNLLGSARLAPSFRA